MALGCVPFIPNLLALGCVPFIPLFPLYSLYSGRGFKIFTPHFFAASKRKGRVNYLISQIFLSCDGHVDMQGAHNSGNGVPLRLHFATKGLIKTFTV